MAAPMRLDLPQVGRPVRRLRRVEYAGGNRRRGHPAASGRAGWAGDQANIKTLAEVSVEEVPRFSTASGELDRVLGGGLVDGSVVLIGGPGIGKSTILLQTLCAIAQRFPALYVSARNRSNRSPCAPVAWTCRRTGSR